MELTRKISARTKTVKFAWAYKKCFQCDEKYLKIRGKFTRGNKATMCKCDWCKHEFTLGEWFALASPLPKQEGPKRNWVLCHTCADLIGATERPRANEKT